MGTKIKRLIIAPCRDLFDVGNVAMVVRAVRCEAELEILFPGQDFLEIIDNRKKGFDEIYLPEVDFKGEYGQYEPILKRLKDTGVKVLWMNNGVGRALHKVAVDLHEYGLLEYITPDGDDSYAVRKFQERYGVDVDDLNGLGDCFVGDSYCVGNEDYCELHSAARWVYENYGWERPLREVVFAAARKTPKENLPPQLLEAHDHYRRFRGRQVIGESPAMKELRAKIRRVSAFPNARVLILGESGTGKETVAMQIHYGSERRKKPFVPLNCATVNPQLIESRLFGFEKSAFTGADKQTKGVFEAADGGTLFLDEIGELQLDVQATLLRTLENRTVMRLGSTVEIPVDVRLIAATNRDLPRMVREGKFRADLYQRLCVVPMCIPPLREHKEDIYEMIEGWYSLRCQMNRKCRLPPEENEIAPFLEYDYPGNVRELHNMLERAEILGEKDWAKLIAEQRQLNESLAVPSAVKAQTEKIVKCTVPKATADAEVVTLEEAMRQYVRSAFELCNENATETAKRLGVSRNTVRKYL